MKLSEETKDVTEMNRLEEIKPVVGESGRTLLDELCGSAAVAAGKEDSSVANTLQSVPPTGISDLGDGDSGSPCWVARTVYGEENPRWMEFREWLLGEAPAWFRNLYVRHGERFARWIAPRTGVKALIRRWMDARIGGR